MTDVVCILDVLSFTNLINHLNHQEELPVSAWFTALLPPFGQMNKIKYCSMKRITYVLVETNW